MPQNNTQPLATNTWIWLSLLLALLIAMLPLGDAIWRPDVLAMALTYWVIQRPNLVGMGLGFVAGLVMDVQSGALLGQHAMSYTLLCFCVLLMQRRLQWFSTPLQALQLLPVFVIVYALSMAFRILLGGAFPGWEVFISPITQALLWPVFGLLMRAVEDIFFGRKRSKSL